MLVADSADKKGTFKVAFLTGAAIFVMGYLNGYSLNTSDLGAMISAQSGNIIWLGINAASGYWGYFLENMGLFLGFAIGCAFAMLTQSIFKNKINQFFYNWTVFIVPILLYPLVLQYVAPPWVSFAVLGFASGAALEFFRKMYHLEINNAMATGNARFFGLHLAKATTAKDKVTSKLEYKTFWIFFICLALFALGAFLYVSLARLDYALEGGINIGLGYYRDSVDASRYYRTLGLGYERGATILVQSNIARVVGFIVICVIPFFFCPTKRSK